MSILNRLTSSLKAMPPSSQEFPREHDHNASDEPTDLRARLARLLEGRFEILRILARGGTASIFLARHSIHHGLFAIKVLDPKLAEDSDLITRFCREGLQAARLAGHPHIIPILDMGKGNGLHYIVMPYVPGEDLDYTLARVGRLTLSDAMLLTMQVNDALLHAWRLGVQHGDLAPGNIRLNSFGMFVVFDFGSVIAGPTQEGLKKVLPPGTPLYISPESILGRQIDIRSDLYSLGAVLYECLTGKAAFAGDSLDEIERAHLEPRVDFSLPELHIHPWISPLLRTLLARSPEDRFSDPLALEKTLWEVVDYPTRLLVKPPLAMNHPRRERLSPC